MSDDLEINELDAKEQRLFSSLPREMALEPGVEQGTVNALRSEGFFEHRSRRAPWMLRLAAAALLILTGGLLGTVIGGRVARRTSLEAMLARDDLSVSDRILLLQRAGSAYVTAAHAYAGATAQTDSTAVEVARQVLVGAAHAVVRSQLDAGVASHLTSVLQEPIGRRVSRPAPNVPHVIWY